MSPSADTLSTTTVTVLGIETSCDETAASVVRLGPEGSVVLSSIIDSQIAKHAPFG
ncbi:MAG: tRNA (adenosine(37)-N6)-threonylcarbamoyltransferase complex transferase subunit TsaD, partial [Caulobacteraceae bacterium]|nr:tRNA (adenosine(37)-N6)-threonylcarbamoyltransferase complex transferase subunit TsaD [Caulobacteraceae bacterium]